MRQKLAAWLYRAQFPLVLIGAGYGWAVIVGTDMGVQPTYTLVAAAALLLGELCLLCPGRGRVPAGCAGAAAVMALSAALLPLEATPWVMVLPGIFAALVLAGLPCAAWGREQDLHPGWYIAGLVGYAMPIEAIARTDYYAGPPLRWPLYLGFVLLLALTLMRVSRAGIRAASAGRAKAPARVRLRNTLLALGYLAAALAVAMLPAIGRAVRALWRGLVSAISRLAAWLTSLLPAPSGEMPGGAGGPPELFAMPAEETPPSAFLVFLERALTVVAVLILALLAAAALRALYRRARVLRKRLMERLRRFAASASEDYVDEVTDTREDAAEGVSLPRLIRRRVSARGESQLPPRERVRHRYLRLKDRHPEWRPGWTARKTLPLGPAQIYERARYSDREVSEEDAEAFFDGVK